MYETFSGFAYDLSAVFDTGAVRLWLLEKPAGSDDTNGRLIDLGRRRLLPVGGDVLLITERDGEMICEELCFPKEPAEGTAAEELTPPPVLRLADVLKAKGIPCRLAARYDKVPGWRGNPTWQKSLHRRRALFSQAGFALQYRGWLDYTFYQFELHLLKKGWLTVDGHDIEGITFWNVMEDILRLGRPLIEQVLAAPQNLSGNALAGLLKAHGLWEEHEWLQMTERAA